MTEHKPEAHPLRSRAVGHLYLEGQDAAIGVDHVFLPEGHAGPCQDCGEPDRDPGMVGLSVSGGEDKGVSVLLDPEEALVLANRLQRAASLALESQEGPPDLERDIARITQAVGMPPQEKP